MDERARRVGQNEAMFREVNERIEGLNQRFATAPTVMTIVCECGDATCVDQVAVRVAAYERIRRDPALFFLVPGHEDPEVEEVVDRSGDHVVVRKLPGEPQRIAEASDPRA